jgi:hypothetical protein
MPAFMCLMVGQCDEVIKCNTVEADNTAEPMTKTELMLSSHAALGDRDLAGRSLGYEAHMERLAESAVAQGPESHAYINLTS